MTQKASRLAVEQSINATNFRRLLKNLRYRVTGTLALLLCVGGFYFLLQEPKPPDQSGLVPIRLPIHFDDPSRNIARFTTHYTAQHYVGFEMTRKTLLSDALERQAGDLVGAKDEQPQYHLAWKVFEGGTLLASGSGNERLHGMRGSTIVFGTFHAIRGKTYRIAVAPAARSVFLKQTEPVFEVGVEPAAVSIGVALRGEFDKLLLKLAGYALLLASVLLFGITIAALKTQTRLALHPANPPPKAATGGPIPDQPTVRSEEN